MKNAALFVAFNLLLMCNSGSVGQAGAAEDTISAGSLLRIAQAGGSGLASLPRHTHAGSATCSPAGTALCTAFETACGLVGGGMSTSPDGAVSCTVAKSKAHSLVTRHASEVMGLKARLGSARSEVATCHSDGSDDGDAICAGFGLACSKLGCGPSTEPDGGVTCTC
jgi:hypothetical protein